MVLTIGNFDGLHLGHQDIIAAAKDAARKTTAADGKIAVMTFDPHPVAILHPEKAPGMLTPLELKEQLLRQLDVDYLIVLKDSFDLLNLSPRDFVDKFLMPTVKPSVIVEGPNFHFGYGRSGNVDTLKQLGSERGFEVIVVPPRQVDIDNNKTAMCSSSLIRNLLEKGNVAAARKALGHCYKLIGRTVTGRGVGKEIGFPTANIDPHDQIIPAEGVYAGFVEVADSFADICKAAPRRYAALSVGRAKTFLTDHPLMVEAHILDTDVEDLGDKFLALDFVDFIRPQQRFESKQHLATQIQKDCQTAKDILQKIIS